MKQLRLLLLPVAWIYGAITALRNFLFSKGWKEVYTIPQAAICVGNLSVGGTGKTPHVAYLAEFLLKEQHAVTILSRGYGRKTKGFVLANSQSSSQEIGDEPKLYVSNFPNATVAVCEKRKVGIQQLNALQTNEIFLLDDAFQHRAVLAGFSIVLTDFSAPYFSDHVLPAGNLREWKCGKKRADVVIVTKCPAGMTDHTKNSFINRLNFNAENVFFSSIKYGQLIGFNHEEVPSVQRVLLVSGIANPTPLVQYLAQHYEVATIQFPDHHDFTLEDLEKIYKEFDTFAPNNTGILITTEKDFVRLSAIHLQPKVQQKPWFYQAISVEIEREIDFKNKIREYVRKI